MIEILARVRLLTGLRWELKALRLSICIPTHNFGQFIGETLVSVLSQISPGVEIVVLDSASTDETRSVVLGLQKEHGCLRYEFAAHRGGIDRDMARVVDLARGEYCWLFSADDVMVEGAVAKVLAELDRPHDLYICMHSDETVKMEVVNPAHDVLRLFKDDSFDLADLGHQLRYFKLAKTTEAFFSFISGLIVRKKKWDEIPINDRFVGSCWAHVARLFELMPRGLTVRFLAVTLVRRRGDNDSFASTGVVRRYALAIQGYQSLASHFWGDASSQAFHIRRVLRNEFRLRAFIAAKAMCIAEPQVESRPLLDLLMNRTYSDWTVMSVLARTVYRLLPNAVYLPARSAYKYLRRIFSGRSPVAPSS